MSKVAMFGAALAGVMLVSGAANAASSAQVITFDSKTVDRSFFDTLFPVNGFDLGGAAGSSLRLDWDLVVDGSWYADGCKNEGDCSSAISLAIGSFDEPSSRATGSIGINTQTNDGQGGALHVALKGGVDLTYSGELSGLNVVLSGGYFIGKMVLNGTVTFTSTSNDFPAPGADVSAVPVPAALPLLISGLAGLGFVGARRKRN